MSDTAHDDSRTAIIAAVWRVMAERGIGTLSMRTVAAAAGVSVGRVQYWFRTKDELLLSSLEAMVAGAADLHAQNTDDAGDRESLWQLVGHPIARSEVARVGVAAWHQYLAASVAHPAIARVLTDAKDGAEREATRLLSRMVPGLAEPRSTARVLIAVADGLATRVLTGSMSAATAERLLRREIDRVLA